MDFFDADRRLSVLSAKGHPFDGDLAACAVATLVRDNQGENSASIKVRMGRGVWVEGRA
jgi:hypothetical protein